MKSHVHTIDWDKVNDLVPAIIQDAETGLVLMLGYMNKEALEKTESTGSVWFYSRTRQTLWMKGETSGNTLTVVEIKIDCDNDTLLIKVTPAGPTCHTGDTTCFKEENGNEVQKLFATIQNRKLEMPEKSYTTTLFKSGVDKIALKVAEESMEVIHAATKQTKPRLIEETVDLIYHLFVLLAEKEVTLDDVQAEMRSRASK